MKRNHLSHRAVISLSGSDRCHFLQGLITNDVESLPLHGSCWAAMLNAQGRIQSLFFLWKDEDALLLDLPASAAEALASTLRRFRLRADVQIAVSDHAVLTGPPGTHPPKNSLLATTDPRHPALGWRAILPGPTSEDEEEDITALLTRRLLAGVPDDADIIPGQTLVLEADMDHLHGVSWTKGCYLGQEVTARTHYRGLIKRRLLPVTAADGAPLPDEGTLTLEGQEVGALRSHAGTHGLALLHRRAWKADRLVLDGRPVTLYWPDWLAEPAPDTTDEATPKTTDDNPRNSPRTRNSPRKGEN